MSEENEVTLEIPDESAISSAVKQKPSKITMEEVVSALKIIEERGEGDVFNTNWKEVRKITLHGGGGTIQKFMDDIRSEILSSRLKAVSTSHNEVEAQKPPEGLLESVWTNVWSAAQVLTLSRIEMLTVERDGLLESNQSQINDSTSMMNFINSLEEKSEVDMKKISDLEVMVEHEVAKLTSEFEVNINKLNLEVETTKKELEISKSNLEKVISDAAHAKENSDLRAEIAKNAMQTTIDNLNDQISNLKSFRFHESEKEPTKTDSKNKAENS